MTTVFYFFPLIDLILYIPVNNLSVMSGRFLEYNRSKQRISILLKDTTETLYLRSQALHQSHSASHVLMSVISTRCIVDCLITVLLP